MLDSEEIQALCRLIASARNALIGHDGVEGVNVGINDGRAAGQTVTHAHVHVIPRRPGDVSDPRGGVRWIFPEAAAYWEQT